MNETMNFGQALEHIKAGGKARRAGWNGKGMWIALTHGTTLPEHRPVDSVRGAAAQLSAERPGPIVIGAHIDMRAADGTLVIGWLASQTDMLADDWERVE